MKQLTPSVLSMFVAISTASPVFASEQLNPVKLVLHTEAVAEAIAIAPVLAVTAPIATFAIYKYSDHGCSPENGATVEVLQSAVTAPLKQINESATSSNFAEAHPLTSLAVGTAKYSVNTIDSLTRLEVPALPAL